jgi:endonuclease YncB( thermonuclease family)
VNRTRYGRITVAGALAITACTAAAATLTARVTDVHDGDTITVRARTKTITIRLVYIDAPELSQSWGRESRRALQELVRLEEVRVRTRGKDKYARTLAEVSRTRDGLDVNLELVRRGMAWAYTRGAARNAYDAAERQAHEARMGLWQDPAPVRPSRWRKQQREKAVRSETGVASLLEPLCLARTARHRHEIPGARGNTEDLGGLSRGTEDQHG